MFLSGIIVIDQQTLQWQIEFDFIIEFSCDIRN